VDARRIAALIGMTGVLAAPGGRAAGEPPAPAEALRAAAFAERPAADVGREARAVSLERGEDGARFAFEARRRAELRRYRDTLDDGATFDGMNCSIFQARGFHMCAQPPWARRK
jgi:hypothetical protein